MKVILRSDLDGLGKRGDIVEVADGYARNYLLPAGPGPRRPPTVRSTRPAAMRRARDLRDAQRPRGRPDDRHGARAEDHHDHGQGRHRRQAVRLGHRRPTSSPPSREQTGIELEREQLDVEPIKTLGQHTVTAKLHSDVVVPDHASTIVAA